MKEIHRGRVLVPLIFEVKSGAEMNSDAVKKEVFEIDFLASRRHFAASPLLEFGTPESGNGSGTHLFFDKNRFPPTAAVTA